MTRMASLSSSILPMRQPPKQRMETRSPVSPRGRVGMPCPLAVRVSAKILSDSDKTDAEAKAVCRNSRRF